MLEVEAAPGSDANGGVALAGVVRVLGGKRVLDGVYVQVPAYGRLGIVGRSGVGKSTLLSLVAGLDEPDGPPARMVRRGSTVRVRQRALQRPRTLGALSFRSTCSASIVRWST